MSNVTAELDVTFIALLISFISIEPEPSESNRLNASRSSSICSSESPPPFFFFPPAAPRRDWYKHTIRKMRTVRHGAASLRKKKERVCLPGSHSHHFAKLLVLSKSLSNSKTIAAMIDQAELFSSFFYFRQNTMPQKANMRRRTCGLISVVLHVSVYKCWVVNVGIRLLEDYIHERLSK